MSDKDIEKKIDAEVEYNLGYEDGYREGHSSGEAAGRYLEGYKISRRMSVIVGALVSLHQAEDYRFYDAVEMIKEHLSQYIKIERSQFEVFKKNDSCIGGKELLAIAKMKGCRVELSDEGKGISTTAIVELSAGRQKRDFDDFCQLLQRNKYRIIPELRGKNEFDL